MNNIMKLLTSERLNLRPLTFSDKHWVLSLQQDELWLKFIGSRNVNTLDDACDYIAKTNEQREEWGYGLLAIEDKASGEPLGVCGLFNRFAFSCPDLGFAILPQARNKGLCFEACECVINWAQGQKYAFLTAMTHPENKASQHLLLRLGYKLQGRYFDKGFVGQNLYWLDLPR